MPEAITFTEIVLLALLPVLLAASGLCSASETALFSLTHADRARLRSIAPRSARRIDRLIERPRRLIIAVLLANTAINVAYFSVSAVVGVGVFDGAWAVAFSALTLLAIIALGDIVPKALATAHRGVVSRVVVRPLSAWVWLTRPVLAVLDKLAITPLLRLIRPDARRPSPAAAQAELAELLKQAGETGALSRDEERMLREVLDLRTLRVRDVMTPRVDVSWIEADAPPERVLELVRRTGHTKLPVCKARFAPPTLHAGKVVSGVLGLLNAKTWLAQPANLRPREALESILYVPDRLPLDRLMARFRETRAHVALAADESGEIVGLVEIEDVVNRLVLDPGEVALDQGLQIRIVGLNRWLIPGRLALHQLTDFFGVAPPASDAATVSGLIFERIGRLPAEGDTVELPGLRLTVRQLQGRSVRAAELELLADDEPTRSGEPSPEVPA